MTQMSSRHPLSVSTPNLAPAPVPASNLNGGVFGGGYSNSLGPSHLQLSSSPSSSPPITNDAAVLTLQNLFAQISRLSEEKKGLQASYLAARTRRKEVQASLQTVQSTEDRPTPQSSAAQTSEVKIPSSVSGLTVSIGPAAESNRSSRSRQPTTIGSSMSSSTSASSVPRSTTPIEQHSARLRSASLERAKQREQQKSGPAFPRTMLSGASGTTPIAVGTPVMTAMGTPTINIAPFEDRSSTAGTPQPSSPLLAASPALDSPSSSTGSSIIGMDPSLFQATQELFLQLRDPATGLAVSDRRWRFRVIPAAFHATEAIDWMVTHKWALDREDAVTIIQALVDQGVIVSVHTPSNLTSPANSFGATSELSGHHQFEDTTDDGALYRLMKDPVMSSYSSTITAAMSAQPSIAPVTPTTTANSTSPSLPLPPLPTWQFTPLVTQCSIALLPSLAHKIEAHCAAIESAAANANSPTASNTPAASSEPPPMPLSTTPAMQQLRTNILYLCNKQKTMWKKEPATTPTINHATDEEGIETYRMEKTFNSPALESPNKSSQTAANTPSASPSATTAPIYPYTSLIQKSRGLLNTTPSAFLTEFLDLKLRRRWEPLLTSGRIVTTLGENTRILHLLTNMNPLGDPRLRPRECVLFQDWFIDTTEQEQTKSNQQAQPTYIVYELSVTHPSVTQVPGYRRGEVLLNARIIKPVPSTQPSSPGPPRIRTELTVISQLDFCFDAKELSLLQKLFRPHFKNPTPNPCTTDYLPAWFLEKWLGLPTSISLKIPTGKQALTVLAHSPGDAYSINNDSLLHSDENGDIFESHEDSIHSVAEESATATPDTNSSSTPVVLPDLATVPAAAVANQETNNIASTTAAVVSVPPPPPPSVDPNYIPEFQPLAVLGRGAYSKILQVRDKDSGTLYAMKVLRKVDVVSVGHESHVLTEQAILARMSHPFVCRLFYAFQSQSKLYMVMTYAAGGDLWTLIRRQKLSEEICAYYTAELVLALRYIHSHAICHRDVKPENILLDHSGHIVLADFGLSHERVTADQRSYSVSGTSEYLSPECVSNKGHGPAMDWWQVGVILHELLTGGKHPFYHKNLFRMQQNILHRAPTISETLSKDAKSLILALLIKDPTQRLGSSPETRDIETHPFFVRHAALGNWGPVTLGPNGKAWERLASKLVPPMYKPKLVNAGDVSHFDSTFTNEPTQDKHTPDSVFNSLAVTSNSLSLTQLGDASNFDTNFNQLDTDSLITSSTEEEAREEMGDDIEDDAELHELMQSQHHGQFSTLQQPQSSGQPFNQQQIHPNQQHMGNDPEQPFHSSQPSNQTHLYNQSPMLSAISPPPPMLPTSRQSSTGSMTGSTPSSSCMAQHSSPSLSLNLPPLPASFLDVAAEMLPPPHDTTASLTDRVDQDYFGSSRGGSLSTDNRQYTSSSSISSQSTGPSSSPSYLNGYPIGPDGNVLPYPGLFLRSQSLPNSSLQQQPPSQDASHMPHSNEVLVSPLSSTSNRSSPGLGPNYSHAPPPHPTSMLPPPRLGGIGGPSNDYHSNHSSHPGTPSSSASDLHPANESPMHYTSSSSLPNSFHPQHHIPISHGTSGGHTPTHYLPHHPMTHRTNVNTPQQSSHGGGVSHHSSTNSNSRSVSSSASSNAGDMTFNQSLQMPPPSIQAYPPLPSSYIHPSYHQSSSNSNSNLNPVGVGGSGMQSGSGQFGSHNQLASLGDYDEIEAQYLEPNEDYQPNTNQTNGPNSHHPTSAHTFTQAYPTAFGFSQSGGSSSTPVSPSTQTGPTYRYPPTNGLPAQPQPHATTPGTTLFTNSGSGSTHHPLSPSARLKKSHQQLQQTTNDA